MQFRANCSFDLSGQGESAGCGYCRDVSDTLRLDKNMITISLFFYFLCFFILLSFRHLTKEETVTFSDSFFPFLFEGFSQDYET